MFPYFTILWIKVYMTWLGIVVWLIVFIAISRYLCKKYSIQFWKLFYRLPRAIIAMYLLWSYVHFALRVWLIPKSISEIVMIISPYGYQFHFIGIIIGLVISIALFLKTIKRVENKKLYSDVLFFGITGALIPLGIFLLLWDDFLGRATNSVRWVQALHADSRLNKFSGVYPIWLWLSILAALCYAGIWIRRKINKKTGIWVLGLIILLAGINIIMLYQQYPRYGIMPLGYYTLDIKQYVSIVIWVIWLIVYKRRQKNQ